MSSPEIDLASGACFCTLEDPEQGSLRLDAVALSTERAILGDAPRLTAGAYVDVRLEFTAGPHSQLFAKIDTLKTDQEDADTNDEGDEAGESGDGADENADDDRFVQYTLRWIHSDPLDENRLGALIKAYVDTDGQFDQGNESPRSVAPSATAYGGDDAPRLDSTETVRIPASSDDPATADSTDASDATTSDSLSNLSPPKDDTPGVVLRLDEMSPAPLSLEDARRSFKYSHLVQGAEPWDGKPRRRPDVSIEPPPRGESDGGSDDVAALLRERAKMVRASDLAARHDHVRVLGEASLRQLLNEAVSEAIERTENSLGEAQRKQLLEEAEEAFQERLETFKAEKADLESKATVLTEQLEKAQQLLEEERQRVVSADQFTVSDAGMVQIESRLERMLHRAIRREGVSNELEGEMRDALSRLLDEERDRISAKAQETQSQNIDLLERKVQRLAKSLDDTARERDLAQKRAQALESAGGQGLRNVITAGLDDDDPDKSKKLGLLKDIFNQNKEMRAHLAAMKARATSASDDRPANSTKGPASEPSDTANSTPATTSSAETASSNGNADVTTDQP